MLDDPIATADTRTLYRAFDRLRRMREPWAPGSPEERMVVLLEIARNLRARGWTGDGSLWDYPWSL